MTCGINQGDEAFKSMLVQAVEAIHADAKDARFDEFKAGLPVVPVP